VANKAQARKLRLQKRRRKIELQLRQHLKTNLSARGVVSLEAPGVVKALRALGSIGMSSAKRAALRTTVTKALAVVIEEMKFNPADLGVRDLDQLSELFVRMLERAGYREYGITELRRKASGLRGIFAGELFELLVLNMEDLQKDLRAMARGQLETLNGAVALNQARLLDGYGNLVEVKGKFSGIYRVTDIAIYKLGRSGPPLKFTDFAYVTYLVPEGGGMPLLSFLVETEAKLPRSAREFSEQIGAAQSRYAGAERIEMLFDGARKPTVVLPEQIVFDVGSYQRTAVTTTSAKSNRYDYRITPWKRGDPILNQEAYLRIKLTLNTAELRRLVNILFRI
jgi:hypothetical protein